MSFLNNMLPSALFLCIIGLEITRLLSPFMRSIILDLRWWVYAVYGSWFVLSWTSYWINEVEIDDDGISSRSMLGRTYLPWAAVDRCIEIGHVTGFIVQGRMRRIWISGQFDQFPEIKRLVIERSVNATVRYVC